MPKIDLFSDKIIVCSFLLSWSKFNYLVWLNYHDAMRKFLFNQLWFFALLFTVSCHTSYQPTAVQYKDYRLAAGAASDEKLQSLLKPYADSVNKSMNDVIAVAATELEKRQPEGTLGNVMADAMLAKARQKYKTTVDASFINYGGIRLPSLAAGNITTGKIFELSPFDNIIVLLTVKGSTLQDLLNHIANRKGWPVAGINFEIKGTKAINAQLNGLALEANKTYTIAVLDYIANGGDDCTMLKVLPQQNNGTLFRDAVIEYLKDITSQGKKISAQIENRVINVQ